MAIIVMAVHDTLENNRSGFTKETLYSLFHTVDFRNHRLIVVDNNSCDQTKALLQEMKRVKAMDIITNPENIGTARAVNKGICLRRPGEHVIKMDNDVVIHSTRWVEAMEAAIERDPKIGIIGLKRKDLIESPERNDFYKSELKMLKHQPGEPWIIVEQVNHVMGTCQMFNAALLDEIGYLYQPRLYGFDDSLAAIRCQLAGFYNCFLSHINIDHIDPGGTDYQKWKEKVSMEDMQIFNQLKNGYIDGTIPIYHED